MKSSCLIILAALVGLFMVTSCDKKSDDETTENEFAELTVEQNKQKLEEDGIKTMQEMDAMADLGALDVLTELMDLLNEEDESYYAAQLIQRRISTVQNKSYSNFSSDYDQSVSLLDNFAEISGIYVYNPRTQRFVHTKDSNTESTYKFVMADGSMALLSLYNFTVTTATDQKLAEYTTDVPTTLNACVAIDNDTVLLYKFEAQYHNDNMLKYHKESLAVDDYLMEMTYALSTDTTLTLSTSFTHNDYVILAEELTLSTTEDYDYMLEVMNSEDEEDELSEDLIKAANYSLQTGNIKLVATVNLAAILGVNKAIFDSQTGTEADVKLLNDNFTGYIIYADSKKMISKSEFYLLTEEDEYTDATNKKIKYRAVFKDGSSIDDGFFTEGFEDLMAEVKALTQAMSELNN